MAFFSIFGERAELGVRMLVPYTAILALLILNIVAMSYPMTGGIKSPLFLMAIYYWSIYRPTLLPALIVFLAGCAIDLMGGLPLGLHALVFVATQWIVTDQRRLLMAQPFVVIWIAFGIISLVCTLLQWLILGALTGGFSSLKPILFSVALGIALFPLVNFLLHGTHKILPAPYHGFAIKLRR